MSSIGVGKMRTGIIYEETYDLLNSGARGIINQGGQWSGKTVGILQALWAMAAKDKVKVGYPSITTITAESFPNLKGGALRDTQSFVVPYFSGFVKSYNKTNHEYTLRNGAIIEYKSFETEQNARGAKRKRLFVNEANSFDWEKFNQLNMRSDQTVVDYNPSIMFWAQEKMKIEPGWHFRISDHRDNIFLDKSRHDEIETFRHKDKELFRVYSRGMQGNITGLIFPNWSPCIKLPEPDDEDQYFYGIDYGYADGDTADPSTIFKMVRKGADIFCDELFYEKGGISAMRIKKVLEENGYEYGEPVYSERDADIIKDIKKLGINVIGARKGPGSVNAGILKIKKMYNMHYTSRSRNLKSELGKYRWEIDKTGRTLNQPIDNFNHAIDAVRYGVYTHYWRKYEGQLENEKQSSA